MGLISHFAKPPCLFGLVIDVNGAEKNFTFGMAVNPTAKNVDSSQKSDVDTRVNPSHQIHKWAYLSPLTTPLASEAAQYACDSLVLHDRLNSVYDASWCNNYHSPGDGPERVGFAPSDAALASVRSSAVPI